MTEAVTVIEPLPAIVLEAIGQAKRSVPRLVLIVGAPNTGKTVLADAIAESTGNTRMNLGLELSRELLPISSARRPIDVEDLIRQILPPPGNTPLVLDNTEILFESYLKLNPLRVLEKAARNQVLVATWNGTWSLPKLTFGFREHPAHFECRPTGFPILEATGTSTPRLHFPS